MKLENTLRFYLNGTLVEIENPSPKTTLLQYLRSIGLTGTKLGCAEGGCGACTVVVSVNKNEHYSMNACLLLLCTLSNKHVITIEGIGNCKKPHVIQERIALNGGSQCGFCTPGIVMSLYALLRNCNGRPSEKEVEEAFDGNLCRCTGYRPILASSKSFCGAENCCKKLSADSGLNLPLVYNGNTLKQVEFRAYEPSQELIFPPGLLSKKKCFLKFENNGTFYQPETLAQLLQLKAEIPTAKFLGGNTEIGIDAKFKNQDFPVLISTDIEELQQVVVVGDRGIEFGASLSLSHFQKSLKTYVEKLPKFQTRGFKALLENLRWFAGKQIRNVGTIAGNIVTASPISDLNPVFIALDCVLKIKSLNTEREVKMKDFFLGYRKVDLKDNEIVASVFVPFTKVNEFCLAIKQSKRRDDDIAIVTCGLRVELDQNIVNELYMTFGGMGPVTIFCKNGRDFALGKNWDENLLQEIYGQLLNKDMPVSFEAPGGMAEYRRTLAISFVYKFYWFVLNNLKHSVDESLSLVRDRTLTSGTQIYDDTNGNGMVGKSVIALSALKQCTGEAIYTDDVTLEQGELFGAFVFSTQAYARIIKVDREEALKMPGIVDYVGYEDVPGSNIIGPVFKDEELFAKDFVYFNGQIIGLIVAHSKEEAQKAAKKVKIEYGFDNLPLNDGKAVLTIEDAMAHGSFISPIKKIIKGDVEKGLKASDHVIEGSLRIGGQNHFYLETQASIVKFGEDDEVEVISSTQNPTETQHLVSDVLGITSNKVVVKVKRMGGGFGGKETRSASLSCALAVASKKLGKKMRMMLDRDEDMVLCGQRHPFLAKYKVGFNNDGKIQALDLQLFSNGGYSADLSIAVMERALSHSDNCYFIPNVRAVGKVCKTNIHSNTAFRGFGGPQGMLVTECWMNRIALKLGLGLDEIRRINFYKEGQLTHFNQPLLHFNIPSMFEDLCRKSDFTKRRQVVEEFNCKSKFTKRGISITPTKFGISFTAKFLNQAGALVHIYSDGSVLLSHAGTEMGQGLFTKMVQVLADSLNGFDPSVNSVHTLETATDKVANTSPTAASAGSDLNGMAIIDACKQLNERLQPYFTRHPDKMFADIVKIAYFDRVNLSANGFYKTPDLNYNWDDNSGGRLFNYFTYGCAVNEVEVDCLTGDHQVLRSDVLMDLGNSLNPLIDVGQIEGAFVQGLGLTTIEESLYFPKNGALFTRGPGAYKIPGFTDIPIDFKIHLYDTKSTGGNQFAVYSSKAVGEPPLFLGCGVFFAILEAVRSYRKQNGFDEDFVMNSPATSERIRLACMDQFVLKAQSFDEGKLKGQEWVIRV